MATWPITLPNPEGSNYGVNPVNQTVRTEMEGGAARVRRRTKARNDIVKSAWMMTDAQLAIFRAWFDDDVAGAAGGAAWFTVSLPLGTTGLVSSTARFKDGYNFTHISALNWTVTASLEIR